MLKKRNFHRFQQLPSMNRQNGVSLIEVLVSMLLISFGMVAMAGMLVFSLNANTNSGNRALATMLAMEYSELIRANRAEMANAVPAYARNATSDYGSLNTSSARSTSFSTDSYCAYPACTSSSLATREQAEFLYRTKLTLPAGDFKLDRVSALQADLWIFWMEASGIVGNKSNENGIDSCPSVITDLAVDKRPRCLYMRITL
jgi:type IV pilus assembly protein PilV